MNENEFRKHGGEEPMSRDEIIDSAWHGRKDRAKADYWRDELFVIDNLSEQVDWCIEEIIELKSLNAELVGALYNLVGAIEAVGYDSDYIIKPASLNAQRTLTKASEGEPMTEAHYPEDLAKSKEDK